MYLFVRTVGRLPSSAPLLTECVLQLHCGCKCVVGDILCVEFVSFVMSLAPYTVIIWSIHDTDRLLFYVGLTALVLSFLI